MLYHWRDNFGDAVLLLTSVSTTLKLFKLMLWFIKLKDAF